MYLAMIMLLGLAVNAKAVVMIDDFESYMSNAELNAAWPTAIANSGLTTKTLVEGCASDQGMKWDYAVDGSTAPGNNSDVHYTFAHPINMMCTTAPWSLDFCLKSLTPLGNFGSGASDILYLKIYGKCADVVITEAWATPNGTAPFGVQAVGTIGSFMTGDCVQFHVTSAMLIDWAAGWPPLYVFSNMTHVTGLLIGLCSNGVESGSFLVDNVRLTPEPATIALLGLGALAMLRRKYSH